MLQLFTTTTSTSWESGEAIGINCKTFPVYGSI